ncbi:MAG: hypothetical protein KHY61_07720, partial [Sutterella wadsworthensis]|nr:hypothetical protein [Sutterella wadsworthensis]
MAFTDISNLVKTSRPALPQIYAYTTPEIARHDGWTKIGYTEQNVRDKPGTEWFEIEPDPAHVRFYEFRENHGVVEDAPATIEYRLRNEQERASEETASYARSHEGGEFLWNAKPRFGKTLTSYDFCKRVGAQKVLIVTNRPAIANSWYDDYEGFVGRDSGLVFISSAPALQGRKYCLTREQY